MKEPSHLTLRQHNAQCLATPRGCLAERAKALRSSVLEELCLLVGGQPRTRRGSVAPACATGEFIQPACAIPSEPLVNGHSRDAHDAGDLSGGCAASEKAEGLEAFGDVEVAFLFVACVECFGGVFFVHCEFSSARR
jgi:hypothetical protein